MQAPFRARWLLLGVCAAAIGVPSPLLAQADSAATEAVQAAAPDEIVVTARSTGETLTQVPVAVTALGAADIARYASTDLVKVAQLSPQIEIYGGGAGGGGSFLIRGIGTTADTAGVDQSVSLSIDGTQIARPRTVYGSMFDLEQVAILKGPQALFFGKNASAGVVSLQSANPTKELSGYVTGGYEFVANERYVEAAVGGPISDTLGYRFAGRFSKLRGWVKNISQSRPDPNNPSVIIPGASRRYGPGARSLAGRATLRWEPTSNYTSTMRATFSSYEDDGATSTAEPVCAVAKPTTLGQTDPNSDCKLNGVVAASDAPPIYTQGILADPRWFNGRPFTDMKSTLLTWQQSLNLNKVLITSNTGYSRLNFINRGNFNGMEFAEFSGGATERYRGWSQELRLVTRFDGPFNVTVGGYYEKTHNYHTAALYLFNVGPDPQTGSYQSGFDEARERGRAASVFGQARWDILDNLELAAGARYTDTRKSASQGQPRYVHQLITFLLPEGALLNSRRKETNTSPEVTLTWHPTEDSTLYGAYKTGYKNGGIALPTVVSLADTATSVIFKPEKAKGGEIGYKAQMFDRRLRFSATGYYYKFTGLQLTSFDPVLSSYRIQNAADAKQKGIEMELNYRASDELSLRASVSYNSLKYGSFLNSSCFANQTVAEGCVGGVQDLTGRRLHRAPPFAGSAGASYDAALTDDFMVGLNADMRYTDSSFAAETLSPNSKQDAYVLLNAGVKVYSVDRSWELALIGRNLTNERVIGFVQDKPGAVIPGQNELNVYGSRPREVALQGTVRF